MAVYNNKTEQWKPFATSAQRGKSNSFLVNDGVTNYPVFYTDWSNEKFRNTSGLSDVSYTFSKGIVSASKHAPVCAVLSDSDELIHEDPTVESFDGLMKGPNYIYFSYWVKIDDTTAGLNNNGHNIFSIQEASSGYGIYFFVNTDGKVGVLTVGSNDGGTTQLFASLESSNSISIGHWHHVLIKMKRSESSSSQATIIGDSVDSLFDWYANTKIYLDGSLETATGTNQFNDENYNLHATPMKFQIGGRGYASIDSGTGAGTLLDVDGFSGSLGPLTMYIAEQGFENLFYELELRGAVHQHSGIHSHPEKTMRRQLDRNVRYAAHFGGLDANHNGLGEWKYIEDSSSWVDPNSVPYLELAGNDTLLNTWRSPSKSVFYSEDLDSISNLGFEIQERVGSTALYQTAIAEPTGILPFDEGKKIGPIGDTEYADRVVIEIPLEISSQATLGHQSDTVSAYPVGKTYGDKHIAYYNFDTNEFDLLESGSIGFSAGQGVGLNVDIPLEAQVKNVCRPTSAFGFPATENYQQSIGTLKLSNYLSDAFILEGYELELACEVEESSDFADWHVGHGWYLYQDVTEDRKYHNPLGLCIPLEQTKEMDARFENSFGTKIITSFLLKQSPIKPLLQKYEDGPISVSSIGFNKSSASDRNSWDAVETESGNIYSLNLNEGISYGDISTQRELITYGQTVVYPSHGELWDTGIAKLYPPAYDGDLNNEFLLRSIPLSTVYSLSPLSEILGDREQYIDSSTLFSQRSLLININQVVDIKSNNVTISNLPFREYQWWSDFSDPSNGYVGIDYLADPLNENIQFDIITGTWAGGHNTFDEVESRATTGVAGAIDLQLYDINTTAALVDADFNGATGMWDDISKLDVSHKYQFTTSDPVKPQEGYILYPEDELILGVQNSVSEKLESVQYTGDPKNGTEGIKNIISKSNLTIGQGRGVLKLFGRYKREDKFQSPTQNFSLYHNIEANEAIGNEDIRDQFELEPLMSYQGSMRDDIVATLPAAESTVLYEYSIDANLLTQPIILNPSGSADLLVANEVSIIDARDVSRYKFPLVEGDKLYDVQTGLQITTDPDGNPTDGKYYLRQQAFEILSSNWQFRDLLAIGFVTEDTSKVWSNYTLANGSTYDYKPNGWAMSELKYINDEYDESIGIIGNYATNGATCLYEAPAIIPLVTQSGEVSAFTVKFLPIVVDYNNPPFAKRYDDFTVYLNIPGQCFYEDDSGTFRPILDDTTQGQLWSQLNRITSDGTIVIYVVAAAGIPVPARYQYEPDSDGVDKGPVYAIDKDHANTSILSYADILDAIVEVINWQATLNNSLLLSASRDSNRIIYNFPKGEIADKLGEYEASLEAALQAMVGIPIPSGTVYIDDRSKLGTNIFAASDPGGRVDGGTDGYFFEGYECELNGQVFTTFEQTDVDWNYFPISGIDFQYTPASDISNDKYNRKVIARTTELIPKSDIFGNSPGLEEFGGGYRSAGSLGSLKKVQSHTMVKSDGTLFSYEDSLLPKITALGNEDDLTNGPIVSTGWLAIDTQWEKRIGTLGLEDDPVLTWVADTDSGTNSFPATGLYQRLSISRINEAGVEWPYSGYTQGVQDETVPVVSELTHEFPELFDGYKTYTNLWYGLGSMPNGKIKVFPRTANFLAWSQSGPIQWTEEMQHEPLRGVRYGLMNSSPTAPTVKFSSRSYGNPSDLYEGIQDSAFAGFDLGNPEFGSPVQVKIYSASNFGVLKGGNGAPSKHPTRSNIDDYQRVYYPWIDDVLYWSGLNISTPPNILPDNEISPWRRNNIKINEAIAFNQGPQAETSPIVTVELDRPSNEANKETVRVDLVNQIKSTRVKVPGSLRSKITKR